MGLIDGIHIIIKMDLIKIELMWILLVTAALYSYFRNRATKTMVDLYFFGSSISSQDAKITEFISSTGDNKVAKSVRVRSYHSYLKLNYFLI